MPRRYYTPELANRSLPLVAAIAEDVRTTVVEMERSRRVVRTGAGDPEDGARFEELQSRFEQLLAEFEQLGVELKDPYQGLLDFRAKRGVGEVYLCWRLGEDRVDHWHELGAGFGGRHPIATL